MLGDDGKGGKRKASASRDKPMTARERVNREGAKQGKAGKTAASSAKAETGKTKPKAKAGTKAKKAAVKDPAKKPKAAKRSTRKK